MGEKKRTVMDRIGRLIEIIYVSNKIQIDNSLKSTVEK